MDQAQPIIEALNSIHPLEWARYDAFKTQESRTTPPIIVARFKSPEPGLVERVKEVVDSFQGNVAWRMMLPVPPRRNFVIAPVRLLEALPNNEGKIYTDVQRELSIAEPSFGEAANHDVEALAARIRELKTVAPSSL